MKKFTPYVSIDLETTGLSHDSDILEIAAIFDDGGPIEELKKFHAIIKYNSFRHAEMYAINMNAKLIEEILKSEQAVSLSMAFKLFEIWLLDIRYSLPQEKDKAPRLTIAGKNAAGFDVPILKQSSNYLTGSMNNENITRHFTHRTLDVGSMYFPHFGENVTLGKINELTGRAANVSHRAMDDAMDVVVAIRHLMKNVV
jgi:oligoribonuclease (3'-5' exoribonuclease)